MSLDHAVYFAGVASGLMLYWAARHSLILWRNRASKLVLRMEQCEAAVSQIASDVETLEMRASLRFGGEE